MFKPPIGHWILAILPALIISGQTLAGMSLDRNIIHFIPGEPGRADVSVQNKGDEPLYVDTEILEVLHPGTDAESRATVSPGPDLPLLVSPGKMVVQPGRSKLLRVVNLAGHGEKERVFRINVKPVAPPANAKRSGIRLFVGYQLLVFLAPAAAEPDLVASRSDGRLVFENRGNMNFLLHSGRQCPPDVESAAIGERCATFQGSRLYPGNRWAVEIPWATPVEFTVTSGETNTRRQF